MGGPSVRLSPPTFHMISAAGRDWAVQFASVTPEGEVTWLTSGLGKTGERKIRFIIVLILNVLCTSVNWVNFTFSSMRNKFRVILFGSFSSHTVSSLWHLRPICILSEPANHRQQKAEICSFIMEMDRQNTSPVNLSARRTQWHKLSSNRPAENRSKAAFTNSVWLCLCVWISGSVSLDKACLAEQGEGRTHTLRALCLGKQWATHPLGLLPN